ncbi:MAG: NAD(P)/FAD-dependent oxidoreductase [Chitinophagales bacterium]|nr:NAD(P)/FAD-dependent oxidoreductase [Chitinophagales bacterium]
MNVAIIGGGAAGFFAAINVKENHPSADVFIFEKTSKLLSKVKISGGGRCNVTNGCTSIKELSKAYPRGEQLLKRAFRVFSTSHAMEWFESRGVPLMIQDDRCVFPVSQDSQSIIDCFMKESRKKGIKIITKAGVERILPNNKYLQLHFQKENLPPANFDKVIVTTGGSPKRKGLEWLESLGHQIEDPVPSLFTFNMPGEPIRALMGIVVENAIVSVQGTKLKADGPLLITHWGMSGPAILKLSAFGARILNEKDYQFKVQVNWVNEKNDGLVREELRKIAQDNHQKAISNYRPYQLPKRLWYFLLERSDLAEDKKWGELGKKGINKITNILTNDVYTVSGKTTFKEEFVTCGGVSLKSIHSETMESKACPNLYFAGEVLDIDGITGGYNFQAAWTTAFIASKLL